MNCYLFICNKSTPADCISHFQTNTTHLIIFTKLTRVPEILLILITIFTPFIYNFTAYHNNNYSIILCTALSHFIGVLLTVLTIFYLLINKFYRHAWLLHLGQYKCHNLVKICIFLLMQYHILQILATKWSDKNNRILFCMNF